MIAFLDVDYRANGAVAACVIANDWEAPAPSAEHVARIDHVARYVPGRFFERELPCLVAVLAQVPEAPDIVVVDGFVRLGENLPGLGAYLHGALGGATPVVGVAKTPFRGAPAVEVFRGTSRRPLLVTAIGVDAHEAAHSVQAMRGGHRIPSLIARVDQLARTA
jgi:deoxyribonuclease V